MAKGIPREYQGELSNPRVLGIPTISFQQKLYSQSEQSNAREKQQQQQRETFLNTSEREATQIAKPQLNFGTKEGFHQETNEPGNFPPPPF